MRAILSAIHWLVWRDPKRKAQNLLRFAEVEADGGRDLVRAAEVTKDPLLRRLFLKHALDEQRHADLFRGRGLDLMRALPAEAADGVQADWLAPGERGLDDVRVEDERDDSLLAFLHLSEAAAARDFANYIAVMKADPPTQAVFQKVLDDEAFHMTYTHAQLKRVSANAAPRLIWMARLRRLWRAYLRLASALAGLIGGVILTLQYFIVLPLFALAAKRAERTAGEGWSPVDPARNGTLNRQY